MASKDVQHPGGQQGLHPLGNPWLGLVLRRGEGPCQAVQGRPCFPVSSEGSFAGAGVWGLHPQGCPSGWTA